MKPSCFFHLSGWWVFLLVCSLSACVTQAPTASEYTGMALVWGKGGGVTGKVTEYVLMPNGQLSERDAFTRELKDVKTLGQAETLQFFRQMTSLPASFHRPGNMYQYIKLEKEGTVQKEAVWGENRFTPPAEIEALHRQLQSLVL